MPKTNELPLKNGDLFKTSVDLFGLRPAYLRGQAVGFREVLFFSVEPSWTQGGILEKRWENLNERCQSPKAHESWKPSTFFHPKRKPRIFKLGFVTKPIQRPIWEKLIYISNWGYHAPDAGDPSHECGDQWVHGYGMNPAWFPMCAIPQMISSWWFQPIWKILVKMGIFPKWGWK